MSLLLTVSFSLTTPVGLLLLYPVGFALFFAPGLAAALWVVRRRGWPVAWAVLLATVPPAAAGYVVFWAYFLHPAAGRAASTAVLAASVVCLAVLAARAAF